MHIKLKTEVIFDTSIEFYPGFYNQSNFYATSTWSLVQTPHQLVHQCNEKYQSCTKSCQVVCSGANVWYTLKKITAFKTFNPTLWSEAQ